jgi:hypothetical protein
MLLAAICYLLITALLFHNLLPVLTTSLPGDLGDPLLNTSILAWNANHLPLSAGWWDFPSFAPLSGVTAFTEHLLGAYPVTSPIVWETGNAVLAYNVLLLACFPLNGLATYALVRELTGSASGALVGGCAFAFAPFISNHLPHVQMLMAFGMPLALVALHRYANHGRGRDLVWFGIAWLDVLLSNAYFLVFFPILVTLWMAWFVRRIAMRRWLAVVATAALATLPLLPLLIGYHTRQTAYGFARNYGEVLAFSAGVHSLAGVSYFSVLWKEWLPATYSEASLFPGFTIAALALVGIAYGTRSDEHRAWRRVALFYFAGTFLMWTFALGPVVRWSAVRVPPRYGPYWLLLHLPGAFSIRVPARAWLPGILCLAVCAGFGAATLASRRHGRWLIAVFVALIAAEGWFAVDTPRVPTPPALDVGVPRGALVLDLPMNADYGDARAQYLAVLGEYRVVNGYSGYSPPHHAPLSQALLRRSPQVFEPFRARADLYVIVRPEVEQASIDWLEMQPRIGRLPDVGDWRVYRLPREGSGPEPPPVLPLPQPGQVALRVVGQ